MLVKRRKLSCDGEDEGWLAFHQTATAQQSGQHAGFCMREIVDSIP